MWSRIRATVAVVSAPSRRQRLELGLGDVQLRALRWLLVRAIGLSHDQVEIPGHVFDGHAPLCIPYLHRGLGERAPLVPLVMVHGFGGDKETWLMMASMLPRRMPLVMLDLPGFGQASPIPGAAMSPERLARAVALFLDRLGAGRFDVAGNSMGGGVSLALARLLPERVRSLTLINSIGSAPGSERGALLGPSPYKDALDRGDNPLIPRTVTDAERMLSFVMTRPPRLPRSMLRRAAVDRVAMSDRLQSMFEGWMAASARRDRPGAGPAVDAHDPPGQVGGLRDLADLAMPALVMCGQRDRVIHPSVSRALARALPRATLRELDDIGHLPQLEAPLRTARIVGEFLATVDT
jgi:abhydrolase domain-containing protein 6